MRERSDRVSPTSGVRKGFVRSLAMKVPLLVVIGTFDDFTIVLSEITRVAHGREWARCTVDIQIRFLLG